MGAWPDNVPEVFWDDCMAALWRTNKFDPAREGSSNDEAPARGRPAAKPKAGPHVTPARRTAGRPSTSSVAAAVGVAACNKNTVTFHNRVGTGYSCTAET